MMVFFAGKAAICLDHHAPSALVMTYGGVATNFITKNHRSSNAA
jgi:hypothetical protein